MAFSGSASQETQAITFASPGTVTYGVSPITLTASAGSGLAVTYSVTSGPATVSSGVLTITGAGSVTVQATQAGNGNWQAASPVSVTFTVNPAALTVTATPAAKTYGQADPSYTATTGGFVNGDSSSVLSGSPSFSVTGTSGTARPAGSYTIYAFVGHAFGG